MTKQKILILAAVAAIVLGTTFASYSDLGEFSFNRGSYVFSIVRAPLLYPLAAGFAALLVFGCSLSRYGSTWVWAGAFLLMMVWLLCGRVVALSWDGRVAGGWFFMRTNTIQLRDDGQEMDDYAKHWTVSTLPVWRIGWDKPGRSEWLFVGPINYDKALALLEENQFHTK